ncbi:DUF2797 domain-containing protein [Streptomyces sp. NPDC002701]|uniref:DUF2797 domain-containing protein n=1 Tax=Streptomyces sp. NPDC002701 TaxID=3364661 RepID=UPI0036CD0AD1
MAQVWTCAGLRWVGGAPVLAWGGGRRSALPWGKQVAFAVVGGGVRRCVGARGHSCPLAATVSGRSVGARCEECARLDRAHSVAADTIADDPRPYSVYLAWFGPGMVKVGITAVERGSARLLEQGAVVFTWLGRGPLMSARRSEELLRTALGVPDRIAYDAKRAVRSTLPEAGVRQAEVRELHARAIGLDRWPEALARMPFEAVDHAGAFGLDGLAPAVAVVGELAPGGVVRGELVAAAGPDLHLRTGRGVVVLDTRLMTGWELTAATGPSGAAESSGAGEGERERERGRERSEWGEITVPVREFGGVQDGLF